MLTIVRSDYTGNNSFDLVYAALTFVGAGVYLWVGRMIVSRQPSNTVGWLLLAIPLIACFTFANGGYATWSLVNHRGTLPFGVASAWIDRWAIVPMLAAFFPDFMQLVEKYGPADLVAQAAKFQDRQDWEQILRSCWQQTHERLEVLARAILQPYVQYLAERWHVEVGGLTETPGN